MSDRLVLVSATPMPGARLDAARVMHRVGVLARRGGGTLIAPAGPHGPVIVPGVRHVVVDVPPGLDADKRLERVAARLGDQLERLHPAIVHAFGVPLAVPALLRRRGAPRVVIEPGVTPAQRLTDLLPNAPVARLTDLVDLEAKALRRADGVVATSTVHASALADRGVASDRTWTITDGVFHVPDAGATPDLPHVVFVGDLDVWSGWDLTLDALARLGCPWRATFVVPPDTPAGRAEGRARALRIAERVHVARLDEDVARWIEAAQVVVCALAPTRAMAAGGLVPEVALLALAGRRPLVAPDLPAVRACVGDAARYFDAGDAGALARAVQGLLEDRAQREVLVDLGAERRVDLDWSAADAAVRDLWSTLRHA